ncbi:hypothetical protein BDR03DRAFT_996287 [Suillus americanus]|nr:hypothetical protein BDR03DRAFT_996287 [Suillus americanus]
MVQTDYKGRGAVEKVGSSTHNVHGPHGEFFYKFLAALEDLPLPLARLKALEAAEKRHGANGVLGGGGRLGGRRITALEGMDPRELAAQAAERRKCDEMECGSGTLAQREAKRAAKESIEDIIDLTDDSPPELWSCPVCIFHNEPIVLQTTSQSRVAAGPSKSQGSTSGSISDAVITVRQPSDAKDPTPPRKSAKTSADGGQWACAVWRPRDPSMGWTCITFVFGHVDFAARSRRRALTAKGPCQAGLLEQFHISGFHVAISHIPF